MSMGSNQSGSPRWLQTLGRGKCLPESRRSGARSHHLGGDQLAPLFGAEEFRSERLRLRGRGPCRWSLGAGHE
jgi:hypothetical protein